MKKLSLILVFLALIACKKDDSKKDPDYTQLLTNDNVKEWIFVKSVVNNQEKPADSCSSTFINKFYKSNSFESFFQNTSCNPDTNTYTWAISSDGKTLTTIDEFHVHESYTIVELTESSLVRSSPLNSSVYYFKAK